MRVAENGHLRPVDHLLDDHMMRVSNPSALSYTEFDGRGFVAVSGADNGLSVFELLPDGLLLHQRTFLSSAEGGAKGRIILLAALVKIALFSHPHWAMRLIL